MEDEIKEAKDQKIVRLFIENNILLSNEVLPLLNNLSLEEATLVLKKIIEASKDDDFFIFDKNLFDKLTKKEAEKILLKDLEISNKTNAFSENSSLQGKDRGEVKILFSYNQKSIKREVSHFVSYFRQRFKTLEQMLTHRKEVQNRLSILRIKGKKEKEQVAAIGMVIDIQLTKNGNIMLTIEDLTGSINILINKNRSDELFNAAKNIVFDEVIGIEGVVSNGVIFVNAIIFPDIPLTKEFKKSPYDEYAAFLGDPHFGSKQFLKNEFSRLISWLNCKVGDEKQKEIASKIKYLIIAGDIVDGVGIYPSQEEDLEITDIYRQYDEFTKILKQISEKIQIIICPGNHDAMRISEPQPKLYEEFCKELYRMPNVILVSSPSYINIGAKENFSGFDVLLYHGFSFPYYGDNVEFIRGKGGLERADLIMEMMLKKRHLAPSHTSTLYIPDANKDLLVIDKVPDFFVTGHIHRTTAKNYNSTTLLNCSCWIGQTSYQEKVGLRPQPARLPIVNLKTREIKILKFGKDSYNIGDTE
jgi:DNA polymerase II small subunit